MSIGVTEVRALWLVEDCVISRCSQLAPGALNTRMAASRFVSVTEEVMNAKKRKFSQKSIKDAPIILELIKTELNEPI